MIMKWSIIETITNPVFPLSLRNMIPRSHTCFIPGYLKLLSFRYSTCRLSVFWDDGRDWCFDIFFHIAFTYHCYLNGMTSHHCLKLIICRQISRSNYLNHGLDSAKKEIWFKTLWGERKDLTSTTFTFPQSMSRFYLTWHSKTTKDGVMPRNITFWFTYCKWLEFPTTIFAIL